MVCSRSFRIFANLQRFDENGIAVDFDHNHKILVAPLGFLEELSCLIRKNGFTDIVDLREEVSLFLSMQGSRIGNLEWEQRSFGAADVFSRLVQMSLWCFDCLWVIFRNIFCCEHRPADVIAGFDCLDPSRLDRKTAYRMHPSNRLFGGR